MEIKLAPSDVKEIIDTKIQLAIVEALNKDPEKMIESVVTAALREKGDRYSRETKLESLVKEAIQAAAKDAFARWVQENKEAIEQQVYAALSGKGGPFVEKAAEKIVAGFSESFHVNASIKVEYG
jgi:post-segregation antitoxin (ccd killing protein)